MLQTLRHEWGYYETILIFWLEVFILGAFNVLRLMVVGVLGEEPLGSWAARWIDLGSRFNRFFYTAVGIGFFVIKFGGFALVIGLFVILLPALLAPEGGHGAADVQRALRAAGPGLLGAAAVLGLGHAVSFVRDFVVGQEYRRLTIVSLAFQPYARMSLVGAVLLAGIAAARLLPGLGRETAFAVVMILLKLGADAASHSLEHSYVRRQFS